MAHALEPYVAEWTRAEQLRRYRNGEGLARIRGDGLHRFLSLGFPTTGDEEWRFTSVAPIAERTFTLATSLPADASNVDVAPFRLPGASSAELVFVNGHYVAALSRQGALPKGACAESLAPVLASRVHEVEPHLARVAPFEHHAFVALNTAFLDDGARIHLPAGTILQQPIHLLFIATNAIDGHPIMVHPRVLISLGANSQASIVETYAGSPPHDARVRRGGPGPGGATYLTNVVTEVVLGENAVLDHYKLQYEGADAYHVGAIHVQAQRNATYAAHSISLGGALTRNDVKASLNGEGVECTLNGLYAADGQRLVDNHTTIDHAQPHCGSREIYTGILADHARGVFNGKIIVRPDAQKTDAKQTNRALLLSEHAQINTKPQLEIFANDVKCTHGAAVGQLDDEALFYLRSRGLSDAAARHLLIRAFAADVLSRLPLEPIRTSIEARLQRQLAQALAAA
jgi:Fe-S cluster assembly protein SufD